VVCKRLIIFKESEAEKETGADEFFGIQKIDEKPSSQEKDSDSGSRHPPTTLNEFDDHIEEEKEEFEGEEEMINTYSGQYSNGSKSAEDDDMMDDEEAEEKRKKYHLSSYRKSDLNELMETASDGSNKKDKLVSQHTIKIYNRSEPANFLFKETSKQ
jgi:hypothetical protein